MSRWLERLLWLTAAVALGLVVFEKAEREVYQSALSREFDEAIQVQKEDPGDTPPEPQPFVAKIEIPRIDLSAMLLDGVDARSLKRGIGHIPGTALPGNSGNAGVAGHRDTFFRRLGEVRKHDRIIVHTMEGEYQYEVESIRIVEPTDVTVLKEFGRPVLTLVTCYPFYFIGPAPKRFVVQAVRL
jgi:sortase A